ncbi:DNA replication/repair protein RecF [Amaricoccus sp.]|uniref:DNA replication/repair protein RecF n=1 Tax=Amaricoccus sp. TaxID=1872485 RepID=UPI001B64CB8D|nr:DNA replication/repair protein RecF [Amaricoccus sp.]MBP7001812.1 DNA replication/repair protein RecF [Amaricoccus sp.]
MAAALAVRRLALRRFRSYAEASLDLPPAGPVAIHGPNGAGKTNLIEAISLLSPGRGLRGAGAEELARGGDPLGWRVAAEVAGLGGQREVVTAGAGGGRSVEIDGKAASQAALGGALRVLWLTPAMDRLWVDAAAERRRFLDRATFSLIPGHAEAATAYDRALRERGRLIRDGVRDPAWFEAIEARMAASGAAVIANRRAALALLAAPPRAEGFPAAELALEREGPETAEALAAAWRAGRGRDMAAGRTLTGPHRDDLAAFYAAKAMPARLASTGEQKAMLISLTLANAAAVASAAGAAPILLLDEVAAHLDAGRRAALYAALAGLGAQAFLTGTGPELFAELPASTPRLAVADADGASRIAAA